ncbi:MAG: hypothetical protein ACFCVG_16175 [Kineosporiaceae bacterium]
MPPAPEDSMPDPLDRLRGRTGHRVVVRYRPDPRRRELVDVLGVLEGIEDGPGGMLRVRADRDGQVVEVPTGSVVAGKPVPPRVSRPARPRRPPPAPPAAGSR